MRVLALSFVVLLTALAGCVGGDDTTPPASPDPTEGAAPAAPTDKTGSLQGEVLSTSLEPIVGAAVSVLQGGQLVSDTKTASGGKYTVNGLAPGRYTIQVNAVGYHSNGKAVEIVAGQVAQGGIQLEPITAAELGEPYVEPLHFKGFLACGAGMAMVPKGNPVYPSGVNPRTSPCGSVDENDEFLFEFDLDPGLMGIAGGMTWQPVGGVSGTELNINIEEEGCGATCPDNVTYLELMGPPDLLFTLNDENIPPDVAFATINETITVQIRVFPAPTTTPNLIYQQSYDIYLELFYNQPVPEGHNPIPDA